MVPGKRRLGRTHAARQHASIASCGELNRSDANDAGGAGHEHGLARFKTAPLEQGKVRRLKTKTQTNGINKAQLVGQPMTKGHRHRNVFNIATILDIGEDTVAGTKLGDALTDRAHQARDLLSGTKRQRRSDLIHAAYYQKVRIIDANHVDVDQYLAWAGNWRRQIDDAQGFRLAVTENADCTHDIMPALRQGGCRRRARGTTLSAPDREKPPRAEAVGRESSLTPFLSGGRTGCGRESADLRPLRRD